MYIAIKKIPFAKRRVKFSSDFTRVIFALLLHIFCASNNKCVCEMCKYMYIFTCIYSSLFSFSSDIFLFYIGHIFLVPKAYNSRDCTSKGHMYVCMYIYVYLCVCVCVFNETKFFALQSLVKK